MNFRSDDLFAELLTKQLGSRFGRSGSISSGAKVVSHQVAHYGIHPGILDGSGLSRDDRSSPAQVLVLLRKVWHTPIGHILLPSLPVVGVNGTTRRIGVGTVAQGRCIGKTGNAQQRHQPRRVLPGPARAHARVRAVHRRSEQ